MPDLRHEGAIDSVPKASDSAADAAWAQVHGASDLQFAPLPPWHPDPPPFWLKALGEWLEKVFAPVARALGLSWPVLQWLIYGLLALGLVLLVWRLVAPLWTERRRREAAAAPETWTPEASAARALLEDADRLAAQGRYDEAAHLLLLRSFDHIATARPEWLNPASTAREIAGLAALPAVARGAFARITALVEQGRYGLRPLHREGWDEARAAYAGFALERLG